MQGIIMFNLTVILIMCNTVIICVEALPQL